MTREEEIIGAEFATNPYFMSTDGSIVVGAHQLGFKHGVEYADAHPKNPWHKTSEELPKADIWAHRKGARYPIILKYFPSMDRWCYDEYGYTEEGVREYYDYYMEIPKLPKED